MKLKLPFRKAAQPAAEEAGGAPKVKKRRFRKKKVLIPLLAVVLVGGFAATRLMKPKAAATQTYTESTAARGDVQLTLSSTGTLEPANQYSVTSSVKGEVLSADFEEGDVVEKGQVLYEIDKTDMQNTISRAQLSLQQSQNNYQDTLDSLDDLNVTADKSGVVLTMYVEEGDEVQAGGKIADVRDSAVMELRVPFNADDANGFWVGESATVTMDGSFETLSGTVKSIDAAETVLDGYQIVKYVTLQVNNPGGLSTSAAATATIGGAACNSGANFTYRNEFTITAETSGKVASLAIDEGSAVSAGQTVATLSSSSVEKSVKNSALSLQDAQLSYQNTVEQLDDYTITAPIAGTVVTKTVKVGDTLDATNGQNTLAVIYDLSYLTFDISLDELDVNQVKVGQKVDVTCDALEGVAITGAVTKVSVAGTTTNGVTTYPVTVQITNVPEGLLPGMNVSALIVVDEAADVVTVPVAAVQRGNLVYVKDETAKNTEETMVGGQTLPDGWKAVKVETGLSNEDSIEIKSGVSEGDVVYVPSIEKSGSGSDFMMGPGGGMPGGGQGGGAPDGGGQGGGRPSGGGGPGGGIG